jgi:iron(III) transport system ATP-binding protein
MTANLITLDGVDKYYEQTRAVANLSLAVAAGEIFVLLGGSGCGKTTTLRLIAGLERPDAGQLWLGGRVVAGQGVWVAPEDRALGMVFQDYALFPHLNIWQNIAFALKAGNRNSKAARVEAMLALVGLSGKANMHPHQLSGGQQQRVALARALAAQPSVILLDEPFSNLDAALRKTMRTDLQQIIKQAGATAVFVTHDQEEAMQIADTIAILSEGRLVQTGKPADLYRYPQTMQTANFLGEANYLPGHANGHSVETILGALPLARPQVGSVQVLLRPEALLLTEATAATPNAFTVRQHHYHGYYALLGLHHESGLTLQARVWAQMPFAIGQCFTLAVQGMVVAFAA